MPRACFDIGAKLGDRLAKRGGRENGWQRQYAAWVQSRAGRSQQRAAWGCADGGRRAAGGRGARCARLWGAQLPSLVKDRAADGTQLHAHSYGLETLRAGYFKNGEIRRVPSSPATSHRVGCAALGADCPQAARLHRAALRGGPLCRRDAGHPSNTGQSARGERPPGSLPGSARTCLPTYLSSGLSSAQLKSLIFLSPLFSF